MNQRVAMARMPPPQFNTGGGSDGWILLILLATPVVAIVASLLRGGSIGFVTKVILMTAMLALIPTMLSLVGRRWGKFLEAILQAIAATIIVTVFSLWLVGRSSLGKWILILFVLLVVILVGQYLGTLFQEKIVRRLSEAKEFDLSKGEISRLKKSAKPQILFYASLPLGVIVATAYGLLSGSGNRETLILFVPVILVIASSILILTLATSAVIMSKSLLLFDLDASQASINKQTRSLLDTAAPFFKIKSPAASKAAGTGPSKNLDMAYLVADLRKVYFYDAVHSTILLIGFALALLSMLNLQFVLSNLVWVAAGGLFVLFLFCYLPYSLGQYYLHEAILDHAHVEGLKRKQLKKSLANASPMYPQSEFFGALLASGTVGGVLSTLAYELMKNALK